MNTPLDFVFLGLSLTSSWGNGHATTYRALLGELAARGHRVLFLERDVPWYAQNRDLPDPPFCDLALYRCFDELAARWTARVRSADVVVVGSYVPEGIRVAEWVTKVAQGPRAFYDIDTPVTLRELAEDRCGYLRRDLVPRFDLYLSFTGGPTLGTLERDFHAPRARPLYCSVDPRAYYPEDREPRWDLGYLGTYSLDRQPRLEKLLVSPARAWPDGRFAVAGAQYPADFEWPRNVDRMEHLAPPDHRRFYAEQRFALNVTRADMVRAGWSPSVRIFESAACGTPIVSDPWPGLDRFLRPGREVFVARSVQEMLTILRDTPRRERESVARRARERVLAEHTAARRAETLEREVRQVLERSVKVRSRVTAGVALEGS